MIRTLILTIIVACSLLSACSGAQDRAAEKADTLLNRKILTVYLSRTNNTKAIAEIIHNYVGGKLIALELVKPYPENYKATVEQVERENISGFLPTLKTKIDSIGKYDVIFIGFPTWGMQLPPPMKSFLNQYDLKGKTIVPFNTHAGYGTGSSFRTVEQLCLGSTILEGFSTKGGVERDGIKFVIEGEKEKQAQAEIKRWLQNIRMLK